MDLLAPLARKVFVPLYERRWGIHPGPLLTELERSQFEGEDRIRDLQSKRLSQLLVHAGQHNAFYRRRFAEIGFDPHQWRGLDDLDALPLLTKDDLRDAGSALLSEDVDPRTLFHKRTGGSTGVPVHLDWDASAHRFKRAIVRRHDAWAGYRLGERLAALWGDTDKSYPWKERVYQFLCERTLYLDTLQLDEEHIGQFVQRLRRARPKVLMGHAHSIFFFTEYLIEHSVDDIQFDGIISTAETLTPSERATIEGRFGPVVFDRYGCEELSLVASECEAHDGLHVAAEGLYVEVLDEGPDRPGRVVVTDLVNRAVPLIRYEVGDLAATMDTPCACGRGLPRLQRVYGRTTDILYAPDGRRISGVSVLDTFVIHVPGVQQAQIVQDAIDHLRLRVVPDPRFGEDTRRGLARAVREVFGPAMRHRLELVERIEPTPRGKYQFSVCEIDPPGRGPAA